MCGIFCSLNLSYPTPPIDETCRLLRERGPDSFQVHSVQHDISDSISSHVSYCLTFASTVLALRGTQVYHQPLVDSGSRSVLCWNGEAWGVAGERVQGNDTEAVFKLLLQAAKPLPDKQYANNCKSAGSRIAHAVGSISGPFSFVFYDAFNSKLFFSRDRLGRRSLVQGYDESGAFKLCSTCDGTSTRFKEVDTNGVHVIDLAAGSTNTYTAMTLPWDDEDLPDGSMTMAVPPMNKTIPQDHHLPPLGIESTSVNEVETRLRRSVELRTRDIPNPPRYTKGGARVAVLFSGGLDCTLLARLSHDVLPENEAIDLLNVAFENPRVVAAALNRDKIVVAPYESCPDRITGRNAFAELQGLCPRRKWRFVAIDISYAETTAHRGKVKHLMSPHNTEMDLSIACALYFASRGQGMAVESHGKDEATPYVTPARVLLSGLGADELFAGYARHGIAYSRNGFMGLVNEIDLDVKRLGKRNLGRDDRVISAWAREARYPYLDEEFLSWALRAPVWEKCGFGMASNGPILDPGKKVLRLLAHRLGLEKVAQERKRAIQFGSRTAKMENSRTKGTDLHS